MFKTINRFKNKLQINLTRKEIYWRIEKIRQLFLWLSKHTDITFSETTYDALVIDRLVKNEAFYKFYEEKYVECFFPGLWTNRDILWAALDQILENPEDFDSEEVLTAAYLR